eukprot:scaffold59892_cov39-Phaeocystis_antarctica.AAC.2
MPGCTPRPSTDATAGPVAWQMCASGGSFCALVLRALHERPLQVSVPGTLVYRGTQRVALAVIRNQAAATHTTDCSFGSRWTWPEARLTAISQTTTHMHGHHEATMGLAGVRLGRELRALALSHTTLVRRAQCENDK